MKKKSSSGIVRFMIRSSTHPSVSKKKKIFFAIVAVLFFGLAAEFISGFLVKKSYILRLGKLSAGRIPDRYLFWRLHPDYSDRKLDIRTNSLGFRNREFSIKKPLGIVRIACLGDSVTFGWKVRTGFTFPEIIQDYLSFRKPDDFPGVEVLNLGIPGYTSFQGRVFAERELFQFEPDVILFSFGINDSQPALISDAANYKRNTGIFFWFRKILDRSNTYLLLKQEWTHFVQPGDKSAARKKHQRVSPPQFRENAQKMVLLTQKHGAKLFFLSQANINRSELLQPYFDIEQEIAVHNRNTFYLDAIDMLIGFDADTHADYLKHISARGINRNSAGKSNLFGKPLTTRHAKEFVHLMGDPVHPNIFGDIILGIQIGDAIRQHIFPADPDTGQSGMTE